MSAEPVLPPPDEEPPEGDEHVTEWRGFEPQWLLEQREKLEALDDQPPPENVELGEVEEWVDPNPPLSEQESDALHAAGYLLPAVDGEWARPEWRKPPPKGRARIDPELVHEVRRVMRDRGDHDDPEVVAERFARGPVPIGPEDLMRISEAAEQGRLQVRVEGGDGGTTTARYSDGGAFILDAPAHPTVVWGDDDHVLWVQGEPFMLVAPQGVGKTTIAAQIMFARVGLLPDVLGFPVVDTGGRGLYLACDRAAQIRRVFRRLAEHLSIDRAVLEERIEFWSGPPPYDFAKHPDTLTKMCHDVGADFVFADSVKDVAVGLSDDEVGSGLNRAFQTAIAEGIEVGSNHHQRKGDGTRKPKTLEDVYGSTWITAGCGSIVLLWGSAGDPIVELSHLKQPAAEVGPWKVEHDHLTGLSAVRRGQVDPLRVLSQRADHGMTVKDLARLMFEKESPNDKERLKARYQLDRLHKRGLARRDDPKEGGLEGTQPARYYPTDPPGNTPGNTI